VHGLNERANKFYEHYGIQQVQSLFLPRKDKHILTEHLAVANTVIFLSIVMACIGLFLIVGGLTLPAEL
jgi:hypothetical protein